jgi:transcriptional regulator of arginine metabolism
MPKHPIAKTPSTTIEEALKSILHSDTVGTQEEIKEALVDLGYIANQSKISRVLHKLGAVKIMNERKQIVYALPLEPAPPVSKNMLSQLIIKMSSNETIIVVHTNPGSASLIGRLVDHNREELLVLGTVAGDDTVFIAPTSVKKISKTLQAIQSFLAEMS